MQPRPRADEDSGLRETQTPGGSRLSLDTFGSEGPIYVGQTEYDNEVAQVGRDRERRRAILAEMEQLRRNLDGLKKELSDAQRRYPDEKAAAEAEVAKAESDLRTIETSYQEANKARNELWASNRQAARRVAYWRNQRIPELRANLREHREQTFALEQSLARSVRIENIIQPPRTSTWKRWSNKQKREYTRRLTRAREQVAGSVQQLRTNRHLGERRLEILLATAHMRDDYWSSEQRATINALNSTREDFRYIHDAEFGQRQIIRDKRAASNAIDRHIDNLNRIITETKKQNAEDFAELSGEFSSVEQSIKSEESRIARKVVEQKIGDESSTGYDIFYRQKTKDYAIRKPNGELVRVEKKIAIAFTASIETGGGHDKNLDVEITAVTMVEEKDKDDIAEIERQIDRATFDYLLKNKWGNLMPLLEKKGIELNGASIAKRQYGFDIPDYYRGHVKVERKSKYIPKREYDGDITL